MSCIFLTEKRVWKLKKPVRFAYLDFSTLEARRRDCELEVALNRRLAPHVYLGLAPVVSDSHRGLCVGGNGPIVDWLVVMRRLPAHLMLSHAIGADTVTHDDVRRLANVLAHFYTASSKGALSSTAYGRRLEEQLDHCEADLTRPKYTLTREAVDSVVSAQRRYLERAGSTLEARAERVVDAHGDLRPEHICLERRPVVIDCLEFNADLRMLDPVSELTFLDLECERLQAPWIGRLALETYARATGDHPPASLVAFYRRHHALVRATIAAWHLDDPAVVNPSKWVGVAEDYLRRARQPRSYAASRNRAEP